MGPDPGQGKFSAIQNSNYLSIHPHQMLFLWPYVAGSLCQSTKGTVREAMRNRSIHWLIDQVVSAWCFIILRLVAFGYR